jgi:hypothetical protein
VSDSGRAAGNEKKFSKNSREAEIGLLPGGSRVYDLRTIKTSIAGNGKASDLSGWIMPLGAREGAGV